MTTFNYPYGNIENVSIRSESAIARTKQAIVVSLSEVPLDLVSTTPTANLVYAYDSSHTVTNQIKANGRLCAAGTTSIASSYAVSNVMLCGRPNQRQSDHPGKQKSTRNQSSRLK
ncbi:hypothetical protein ECG_09793 [Echinococcus granulosus]|nr:hypothetical protein ECG_09793 [Echinococcus granulosus]